MNEFISIKLNKNSPTPIYQQLGDGLRELITQGILKPESKLPPIRKMAESLKVNNVTVVNAYKYLENKKVVYSQAGSGTYVSPIPLEEISAPVFNKQITNFNHKLERNPRDMINFANTAVPTDLFPVADFKKLFNDVLDRDGGKAFDYQDSQGYEALRNSICHYVATFGIKTTADKIQIISGSQQGLDIMSKVMLKAGDVLFVEKPTFYGAAASFLSRGGMVVEIPLLHDGLDMVIFESYLKLYKPKFIYLMTNYQTPTGISYSLQKKKDILELADQYDFYIIEEDNQSDFNYYDHKIIPLKALDYKNKVVYIKSFSKILMPGIRLGFMILPKKLHQSVLIAKHTSDIVTSSFIQRALDLYLQDNSFFTHTQNMKHFYKLRYEKMIGAIHCYLKDFVHMQFPDGGLSVWLTLKQKQNIEQLCNEFLQHKVIVIPGNLYCLTGEENNCIRLSFSNVGEEEIEEGIEKMGEVLKGVQ